MAVTVIAATMGTLFEKDKKVYVSDLTVSFALHAAQETNTTLQFYKQQLTSFSRLLASQEQGGHQREESVRKFFEDYSDFLSVTLYDRNGEERIVAYDLAQLDQSGIDRDDLAKRRRSPQILKIKEGQVVLKNSTLSSNLPSFTMAFSLFFEGEVYVVSSEIHLKRFLRLGSMPKVFEAFLVDSSGNLFSHPDIEHLQKNKSVVNIPVVSAFRDGKIFAGTLEYLLEGKPYLGAYATVDFGLLGAIVQIPKEVADLTARELIHRLVVVSLGVLIFSSLVSFIWSRSITKPIQTLSEVIPIVASGNFDIQIAVNSRDEIGLLAVSFNQMAAELKRREEALKLAHAALLQSEKMAAFGELATGIAHEVRNPLSGILGYAQLALRKIGQEGPVGTQFALIEKEAKRCKSIIEKLMKFSRQEKTDFLPTDLNQVVEETLILVDHLMATNSIVIEKFLTDPLPKISGDVNQLMQVMMNLLINAQQAMPEGGVIKIATRFGGDQIELLVADTGGGIPRGIQSKIFQPFFTTKSTGQGTGMGLSVSYGVVQEHQGKIWVESEEGRGATFIVTFPILGLAVPDVRDFALEETTVVEKKTG